ncbi:sarcosine oxidase subunit delta [Sphingomonas sp.]|uniref:sarcosine oxidase subunit delta n=1 Tax=Sphingomonas sp. TaxID=28214 RepID=UPI003D6CC438
MLLINCPYCGPRSEIEFRCGGESHIERPGPLTDAGAGEVSDEAWADYLFYRQNPKAEHRERWLHAAGCRRWFNVARDTVTHRIRAVYAMGDPCPEDAA